MDRDLKNKQSTHTRAGATQAQYSVISVLIRQKTVTWGGWTWAAPMSGTGITGGGSGYAAHLAHAEGVLYDTELGSVTSERVGLFCFPIKHSTHTHSLRSIVPDLYSATTCETCLAVTFKINTQHTQYCNHGNFFPTGISSPYSLSFFHTISLSPAFTSA